MKKRNSDQRKRIVGRNEKKKRKVEWQEERVKK